METIHSDILIVGGGGAGLQAALTASENTTGTSISVLSKLPVLRSQTAAARGGLGAALANEEPDTPEAHARDTLDAGAGLSDTGAVELVCEKAPAAVKKLADRGIPLTLNGDNNLAQRKFAGHKSPEGQPVKRACYGEDRTGQLLLHGLYEQCLQSNISFYEEHFALRLLGDNQQVTGLTALDVETGHLKKFKAGEILLATGGAGQLYEFTTNSLPATGDGRAMVARAGLALMDMEFVQFHPTALNKTGILVTEASRSVGGILLNDNRTRFMENYAPEALELAPRDVVSRAITEEIEAGRGINGRAFVHLDLTGLEPETLEAELPEVLNTCRTYLDLDPRDQPLPVKPAAHYFMGGIPTDTAGRVLDINGEPVAGLYAAGEAACVSIHGANRLGTNSLAEIVVMGEKVGRELSQNPRAAVTSPKNSASLDSDKQLIDELLNREGNQSAGQLREKLGELMNDRAGIFRDQEGLKTALQQVQQLKQASRRIELETRNRRYNQELISTLELKNMLINSEIILSCALERTESRGAHYRRDYPEADSGWAKHTLASFREETVKISTREVH